MRIGILIAASMAVAAVATAAVFRHDLNMATAQIEGRSESIQTRFGKLEFVVAGAGTPLLMVHGTGGGFDQALLFTDALRPRGFRVIAPSRFGYLGSDYPPDPSSENQADAFVELLDRLGIERIVIAGGSAGALPAAAFALRHPERCAGLILLVPASNLSGKDPVEMSPLQVAAVKRLAGSDFLYWAGLKQARNRLVGTLLATDPALLERASPAERARAEHILQAILPISRRKSGMLNDGYRAGSPVTFDYGKITVPTLIISVKDDRFGTAATARALATRIPHSQLVIYPTGGHIWLGHDQDVAEQIATLVAVNSTVRR